MDETRPSIDVQKGNEGVQTTDGELMLLLIKKGSGIFEVDQVTYSFMSPALLCLHENQKVIFRKCEGINAVQLKFNPSFVNKDFNCENIRIYGGEFDSNSRERHWLMPFVHRSEHYKGYLDIGPSCALRVEEIVTHLESAFVDKSDGYWPCRTRSYLIELLVFLERLYMDIDRKMTPNIKLMSQDMDEVFAFINEHYHERINIKDLTDRFNISRTTLNERFKKAVGFTINAYIIQLRIKTARSLLSDTELPISEIMYRVGFNDHPYFIKTFRKYMNLSPSEYRKINLK